MSWRWRYMPGLWVGVCFLLGLLGLGMQQQSAYAADRAFIRVIQAVPGLGGVTISVDGVVFQRDFAFAKVSGYVSVPAGSHHIFITPTHADQSGHALDIFMVMSPGTAYTIALLGTAPDHLTLQAFIDDNILSSDGAKVRLYQLAATAGAITVSVSGSVVASHLSYQNTSNYFTLPAGTYTFEVMQGALSARYVLSEALTTETVDSIFLLGEGKGKAPLRSVHASVVGMPGPPVTGSDPGLLAFLLASLTLQGNKHIFLETLIAPGMVLGFLKGLEAYLRWRKSFTPAGNFPSVPDAGRPSDLRR